MGVVVVVHPGVEPLSGGIPEPSHRCGGGAELVEERHRPFSLLLCVTCHADSNLGPNPVQLFVRTPLPPFPKKLSYQKYRSGAAGGLESCSFRLDCVESCPTEVDSYAHASRRR